MSSPSVLTDLLTLKGTLGEPEELDNFREVIVLQTKYSDAYFWKHISRRAMSRSVGIMILASAISEG